MFTVQRPVDAQRLKALSAIMAAFESWSAHHRKRIQVTRTELQTLKDMAGAPGRASNTGAGESKKGAAAPAEDAELKVMIDDQEVHVKNVENEWISKETASDIVTCIAVATELTRSLLHKCVLFPLCSVCSVCCLNRH